MINLISDKKKTLESNGISLIIIIIPVLIGIIIVVLIIIIVLVVGRRKLAKSKIQFVICKWVSLQSRKASNVRPINADKCILVFSGIVQLWLHRYDDLQHDWSLIQKVGLANRFFVSLYSNAPCGHPLIALS